MQKGVFPIAGPLGFAFMTGRNTLPRTYARIISDTTGFERNLNIVQINSTYHIQDTSTGRKEYVNIEVDVGYKAAIIQLKVEGTDNLVWYTDSERQMQNIRNESPKVMINIIGL